MTISNPYLTAAKNAMTAFMNKNWMEGWQWQVVFTGASNATGMSNVDIYVKDVDFGGGSIDVDVKPIGTGSLAQPTYSSVSEVTLTMRETKDCLVSQWVDEQISNVKNDDGTLNLPSNYVFDMKIYTLDDDGNQVDLLFSDRVFAIKRGNITLSREAVNQFQSFPVIFHKFSSVGNKAL